MQVRKGQPGGVCPPVAVLASLPSPHAMPYFHSARQAEPLVPLAGFLLAPLLLAAGARRHAPSPAPSARAASAPAVATPLVPSAGGTRGR
jgi:hypothetical protein